MSTQDNDPRRRVLDLMHRMAKATALGGAALGLSAAESCSPLVCDPLPPPITCANPTHSELQNAMLLSAHWEAGDAGALQVRLQVTNDSRSTVTFSQALTVTGATAAGVSATANSLSLALLPTAGATTVTVLVPFDCAATADSMTLSLALGTPAAGASVPVTITTP